MGSLPGCNDVQLAILFVQCRSGSRGPAHQGMRQGSGNGPRSGLGPAQAYTRGIVPRKRYADVPYGMLDNLKGRGVRAMVFWGWVMQTGTWRVGAGLWGMSGEKGSVLWNRVIQ